MGDAVQPPATQSGNDNEWHDQVPPIKNSNPDDSSDIQ